MKVYQQYINGEFRDSSSDEKIEVINPYTEQVVSVVPNGNAEDAQEALDAAQSAQPGWAAKSSTERGVYLKKIAQAIRDNRVELAQSLTQEQAKVSSLAQGEVDATAEYFDYYAGWARKYEGEIIESDQENENIMLFRQPIGVVVGICPWNFPFYVMARKVAPSILTGNTVVVKPSSETPNTSFEFARLIDKLNLPEGIINIVSGGGSTLGNELVKSPITGMVTLTGSVEAGQRIIEATAQNITKTSLELGGKAPAIVCADADLDIAIPAIVTSRIRFSGQVCNCAERVYVDEKIADEFTARLTKAMQEVTYGDPAADPNFDISCLVSKSQLENVERMTERAKEEGAEVLVGGERPDEMETGYFYKPTLLGNCTQKMEIVQQEVFGPVLPIVTFSSFEEAIELANDCEYGLTSSIFSKDVNKVMAACNKLKFGETYVNRQHGETMQGFHAGWRKSGIGGADGKHGLYEYLQTHMAYIKY